MYVFAIRPVSHEYRRTILRFVLWSVQIATHYANLALENDIDVLFVDVGKRYLIYGMSGVSFASHSRNA